MFRKSLEDEDSHGAGLKQRDPAWPRPQAPLHGHDLHTPAPAVDVFPDFFKEFVPLGLAGRSKGGFFGARLGTSLS